MPEDLINAVERLQAELAQAREQSEDLRRRLSWQARDALVMVRMAQNLRAERDEALAVVERAREIITRLVELGHDDGAEPEDAWTVAWGHAEQFLDSALALDTFDAAQQEDTA